MVAIKITVVQWNGTITDEHGNPAMNLCQYACGHAKSTVLVSDIWQCNGKAVVLCKACARLRNTVGAVFVISAKAGKAGG
jgi:hypothetical protein